MEGDNYLLGVAIFAIVVSVVATGFTIYSIANLAGSISGYAVGETNLTVESTAVVNFSTRSVDWGTGRVNSDADAAALDTTGVGSVVGGNFSTATGLIIENTGNKNVTLNITGTKTAATFLGGTSPVYQMNVTDNEAGSCLNSTGGGTTGLNLNSFHNVNTTVGDSLFCNYFRFESGNDQVRVDFNVTVPQDSSTGALGDIITATIAS
jgi:hypothetical protein